MPGVDREVAATTRSAYACTTLAEICASFAPWIASTGTDGAGASASAPETQDQPVERPAKARREAARSDRPVRQPREHQPPRAATAERLGRLAHRGLALFDHQSPTHRVDGQTVAKRASAAACDTTQQGRVKLPA